MRWRDTTTLLMALAAHLAYYSFADLRDRRWCFYVAFGAVVAWVGWCMRQDGLQQARPVLAYAGAFLLIEGVQQAACGWAMWRQAPGVDLCVAVLGADFHALAASLLLAGVLTWGRRLWPNRPPPR